jgi:hypothetical protein
MVEIRKGQMSVLVLVYSKCYFVITDLEFAAPVYGGILTVGPVGNEM